MMELLSCCLLPFTLEMDSLPRTTHTHTRRGYFYTHVMTKNDDDSEILQGKNLPLKNVSSHFDLING